MHLSPQEFKEQNCGVKMESIPRIKRAAPQYYSAIPPCTSYPTNFSWVDLGKVQAIKNQQSCGSCYIFASLGVLESAVAIKYGILPPRYSEQHNLDCITKGCNGGWFTDVWSQTTNGVVPAVNYKDYTAVKGTTCNTIVQKDNRATVDIWYQLPENNEAAAICYLKNNGPLWAAIWVSDDFQFIGPNGVYDNPDKYCIGNATKVNHAVMLVGYGTTLAGVPYWLVRNSWDTTWGDFFFVK
jgi:hypothetical protein